MGLGPIISRKRSEEKGQDVWTYEVRFSSLSDLKKEISGKMRLSVPIAQIHQRVFKVWFKFGLAKVDQASKSLLPNNQDNSDQASEAKKQVMPQASQMRKIPQASSRNGDSRANNPGKALAKYQVSPKTRKLAEIAIVKYPIGLTVTIFTLIDCLIIALAIYLRKRMKGKKKL